MPGGEAWVLVNGKWVLRSKTRNNDNDTPAPPPAAPPPAPTPTPTPTPPPPALVASPTKPTKEYVQALFPYLSEQDRMALGVMYGIEDAAKMRTGRDLKNTADRAYWTSAERARSALTALANAATAGKFSTTDSGYVFLTEAIRLLQRYGGATTDSGGPKAGGTVTDQRQTIGGAPLPTEPTGKVGPSWSTAPLPNFSQTSIMSRANYKAFQTAFQELMTRAKQAGVDSFYTDLASTFLNPTLVGGSMMPTQTVNGRLVFGQNDRKLYT